MWKLYRETRKWKLKILKISLRSPPTDEQLSTFSLWTIFNLNPELELHYLILKNWIVRHSKNQWTAETIVDQCKFYRQSSWAFLFFLSIRQEQMKTVKNNRIFSSLCCCLWIKFWCVEIWIFHQLDWLAIESNLFKLLIYEKSHRTGVCSFVVWNLKWISWNSAHYVDWLIESSSFLIENHHEKHDRTTKWTSVRPFGKNSSWECQQHDPDLCSSVAKSENRLRTHKKKRRRSENIYWISWFSAFTTLESDFAPLAHHVCRMMELWIVKRAHEMNERHFRDENSSPNHQAHSIESFNKIWRIWNFLLNQKPTTMSCDKQECEKFTNENWLKHWTDETWPKIDSE